MVVGQGTVLTGDLILAYTAKELKYGSSVEAYATGHGGGDIGADKMATTHPPNQTLQVGALLLAGSR